MQTTLTLNATALPAVATRRPIAQVAATPRRARRNPWAKGAGESRVATAATAVLALCLAPVIAAAFAQVFVG